MRISDVSIRNPVFAWMVMAALIIFGAISFSRMGVSQLPDVDFPTLSVSLTLEGAAPEIMELTVVDPIENALTTIEGIKNISSSSKTGQANIKVEFELERNIDVALQEVQTKLSQTQRALPDDLDPPVISKTNPDDQPIMWLALTYDKDDPEFLMKYARDFLKDRFTSVSGVGDVQLGGYTDPALRVWVKPTSLVRYNISVNDIIDAIQTEHSELPGGYIETDKRTFNVRTMGEAKTVKEFENIVISRRAGQLISDPANMVKVKDVATVIQGLDEIRRISRFNGQPALGLGIKKQRGSNAVAVADAVKARMKEIEPLLPQGMKMGINNDSTKFIKASIHELLTHLAMAVLLTAIVCWVFLGSWSATLNVLLAIPTSIIGAFIGMYFLGFTLNTFTLLGLTLAIGIVVDDAIMVLENIFRYSEKGRGQIEAAIIGAREIAFAAMAASVAVVAIFLPVAFMKGIIGKFFLQFGVTISLAVMLSLIESLTITPMRCATFVHMTERTSWLGKKFEEWMLRITKAYTNSLNWTLGHRWKILVVSLGLVAASFLSIKFLPKEMVPQQDMSLFLVRMQTPVGTSLKYTDDRVRLAEKWFLEQPELAGVYVAVGGFSGGVSDANTAIMFISMKEKEERTVSQAEFMDRARQELRKIKDAQFRFQDLSARGLGGGGRGFPVEFTVMGPEWDKLAEYATTMMKQMEESGMMTDVDSNYLLGMPEFQIQPDREQATLHGVSIKAIGTTVNALIGGVRVGQFPDGGHRYDIRVQLEKQRDPEEDIEKLLIGNNRSNLIPITRVVHKEEKKSLQSISRDNRQRAITIYANLAKGASQEAAFNKVREIGGKILAPGYMIGETGSSQQFKETFTSLIFALILGFAVAYMVLASQFTSFIDPVSVLMALPFSFSGAFFSLLLTGQSLNMYSMIGLLLLMGIVKKNSILLVEFTNTVRDRGINDANKALLEACPTRLRPILMTSFATMAAAIPSALATGAGAETFRPMAITIIGGVLVSTALTLYVVPCFYSLMDRFRSRDEVRAKTREAFAAVGDEAMGH